MGKAQRDKGQRGEREFCKKFQDLFGIVLRRSYQFRAGGNKNNPDVQGLKGFHVEVKNQERLNIWDALNQALSDCAGNIPVVAFKRNRTGFFLAFPLNVLEPFCVQFLELIGYTVSRLETEVPE